MLAHDSVNSVPAERSQSAQTSSIEDKSNTCGHKPEPSTNPAASDAMLVETLQSKFSKQLLSLGKFDVQHVEVKIGKDIHKWPLATRS